MTALAVLVQISACSLFVRGPVSRIHLPPVASLVVQDSSGRPVDYTIVGDTIRLPHDGVFKVVFVPLELDTVYSLQNARSERVVERKKSGDAGEEWIQIHGKRRIGIVLGRSMEVCQAFDLSIMGTLSDSTSVEGRLVDDGVNQNSDVFTRRLNEFDQVFVRLTSPSFTLRLGDLGSPSGEPSKYQGIEAEYRAGGRSVSAMAAVSRARKTSTGFRGRDGYQGPYFLKGEHGENVSIVPGSETVFLNSVKMERGNEGDYTIDYEQGSITFTPARPIRDGDTIVVHFAYMMDVYPERTVALRFSSSFLEAAFSSRSDDASGLSAADRESLAVSGDSAWLSGYRFVGHGKGDYELRDGHFVFVGAGNGDYVVHFEFVGAGNGDYDYDRRGYFVFVGQGNGSFRAGRRAVPPSSLNSLTLNANIGGLQLRSLMGTFQRNAIAQGRTLRFYRIDALFQRDAGLLHARIAFKNRSPGLPRELEMPFEPRSHYQMEFSIGNEALRAGLRLFYTDDSIGIAGNELFSSFNGDMSIYGSVRTERRGSASRRIELLSASFAGFSVKFREMSGDSAFSHLSLSYARGAINFAAEDRADSRGHHRIFVVGVERRSDAWSFRFDGNLFFSSDTVRRSASLSWQVGGFSGRHELTYGASYIELESYEFVGEGHGNYSFDPATGSYYRDPGGAYVRSHRRLPSEQPAVKWVNSVQFNWGSERGAMHGFVRTSDIEHGARERKAGVDWFWKLAQRTSLRGNFFGESNLLGNFGKDYSYHGELSLEHGQFQPFIGIRRAEYGYMPERWDRWIGVRVVRYGRRFEARFTRVDGIATIDVLSFSPDIRLHILKMPVEIEGEIYYGFLKGVADSRWATPRVLPIGLGYRYRLRVTKVRKDNSNVNFSIMGTRFTTRFSASLELGF